MSEGAQDVGAAGVREGDVLAGKYRVDRVLGVGGMGVVVAAHHMQLDDKVAIKFLLPEAIANADAVARFDREARAAVRIKSEHVARVIDVGKLENGAPYMVMEYLQGSDLSGWLAERGPLPIEQAVDFVLQACEAIAEAHAMGVVHRDLKPANLFCIRRPDGAYSIKVLDFGISKVSGGGQGGGMSMTRTTTVMGSPLYMSPEQMESSKGVDPRADIWALGVILYELVCGKVPFHGEAITELVLRIVTMNPTPMPMARPDVPEGLERTILRCLEKNRENRFSNVGELAAALIEFSPKSRLSLERIRGVMLAAGISATPSAAPPPPPATTQSSQQGTTHQQTAASWGQTGGNAAGAGTLGRVPRAVIGISAVGAVLAVTLILVLARKGPSPAPSAAASVPPAVAAASSPTASPVAPPPAAAPVPVAAGPGSPSPADSGAPSPSPVSAPAPTAAASPAKNAGSHPHAAASAAPAAPAPAKTGAKPNCDPPYFMDASGHRQYKPECF